MNHLSILSGVVVAVFLVAASPLSAAVFDQRDIARLTEINGAIQSLKQDLTTTLKSLPPSEVERIQSYGFIEMSLEAAQERLGAVLMLVMVSSVMETTSDQFRVINVLYAEIIPQAKIYLNARRNGIILVASAHPSEAMFASYSTRASNILSDRAISLLDEFYRRMAALHK